MNKKEEIFLKRVQTTFQIEAQVEELVQKRNALNHSIVELTKINTEIVELMSESYKWKEYRSNISSTLWNKWIEENNFRLKKLEKRLVIVTNHIQTDQNSLKHLIDDNPAAIKLNLIPPISSLEDFKDPLIHLIRNSRTMMKILLQTSLELSEDQERGSIDAYILSFDEGFPQERTWKLIRLN